MRLGQRNMSKLGFEWVPIKYEKLPSVAYGYVSVQPSVFFVLGFSSDIRLGQETFLNWVSKEFQLNKKSNLRAAHFYVSEIRLRNMSKLGFKGVPT